MLNNMRFAPYSFSTLNTFSQCKRKFKYAKIDKAPKSPRDLTPLIKGGAVHSILEHFPAVCTHKRAPEYQHIVDKFLESELGKKYLLTEHVSEFNFGLLKSLKPCEYYDKEALFRGKIDHICIIENMLNLNDFKTGKFKAEKYQDFNQLLFYAIYFFILRPEISNIKISYVFVEHDMENFIILDRKYLEVYIKSLIDLITASELETEYKKTISPLCPYCEYLTHCQQDM